MKHFFLILVLTFCILNLNSQENVQIDKSEFKIKKDGYSDAIKNLKYGDYYYEQKIEGGYEKALKYYLLAADYNPNNPELNYKIGVCYIESVSGAKSLDYLENSYKTKPDVANDITFYLARAYHLNSDFDNAIIYYKKYLSIIAANENLTKQINKNIEECNNGKILKSKIITVSIKNLEDINSSYKDYFSMITADGKKMYFSSRRPNKTGDIDPKDDQYYEDIYFSQKDSTGWSMPINVKSLNTPFHDDVVGLSHDGNTLITYKDGDLYYCNLNGNTWSDPKAFPKQINSNLIESSACFSPDGKTLYFVRGKTADQFSSNSDIYFSTLDKKNNWSEAKPLPSNINSPYDEDGLFLFADGKTLYFSSKGHNTMGGFDVFRTTINPDGSFSDPVNLGYPINSPNNDIYFVMEPNNVIGYYTVNNEDAKGYTDIYQIKFLENTLILNTEDNLIASVANPIREIKLEKEIVVVIQGTIIDQNTGMPIDADIEVIDNNTNQIIYSTRANSQNGEYSITIPAGKNYGIVIRKDGYLFHSENFDLVSTSNFQEISKDVKLQNIQANSKITLNNIFFNFASSVLQSTSIPELERIVKFLEENPNIKIEISGHTDNIGSSEQNMYLSKQRAQAVADFIIQKGISADRIETVGLGYSKPVADNSTPEGRQANRRVELKIKE